MRNINSLYISSVIFIFYNINYRLREFIINYLKSIIIESIKLIIRYILSLNIALQLVLSYSIDFKTIKDNE